MAGAAGQNIDSESFIFDPSLDDVVQHYKEIGARPVFSGRIRGLIGGYRTVKIPTASVLTLNATPIQIVPAAGAGTLIIPTMVVATLVFNSAAYSTNSGGATLKYGTAAAGTSTGFTLTQGFLQTSTGTATQVVNQASAATYLPATTDYNVPLTLIAASSDPTTGDSDIYVRVWFKVITTLPFAAPAPY